ncbi:synapse differentiation-inducing gene protein 1-like isoform X1 [Mercenaria mercenaria]|uniref:synapse differentiation-inducing gene protein 1-like isoform X1 n=1 Tax=Mercenaria mercenaria TaxID=6596 RepID=UPI00234ED635|nr:synapse differentiation-inducing gene protein 1-like isoform X1 [Mercenaria mercenaria]
MAERAGYDQPGDGYTDRITGFELGTTSANLPGQHQSNLTREIYTIQSSINSDTNQPQVTTVILQSTHPDYMVVSLFACIFCFWPTGVCALYYANEANNLAEGGDYEGARRMSIKARNRMITSVVIGIILMSVMAYPAVVAYNNLHET